MSDKSTESEEIERLLERVQDGDVAAFNELFSRYRKEIHHFIEHRLDARLRSRVDASDVVQETQLEAFQRLRDFLERRPMPFRLWLHKTAYERCLKIRRQHLEAAQRDRNRELQLPERSSFMLMQHLLAQGSTPSQQISRRELVQRIKQAVGSLQESDQEILLMRNCEGLKYEEISVLLEIDAATARKRYGRALLRLRTQLAKSGILESES